MKKTILVILLMGLGWSIAMGSASADSTSSSQTLSLILQQKSITAQDSVEKELLRQQIENTKLSSKRKELEDQLRKKETSDSLKIEQLRLEIELNKEVTVGYPVVLGQDTVITLHTNFGSFSAAERAENTRKQLRRVVSQFDPQTDTLSILHDDHTTDIKLGKNVILTIGHSDALWHETSQQTLAQEYAQSMQLALEKHKKETGVKAIIKQIGLSLLVIVVCVGLIYCINLLFSRRLSRLILDKKDIWFKGVSVRNYQILNSEREIAMILFFLKILRYLLIVVVLYVAIPLLFSIFPATRNLADTLFAWILSPVKMIVKGVVDYIPNILIITVIYLSFRYLLKGLKFIMHEIEQGKLVIPGFYADWSKATFNILRTVIYAFCFVMIFPYLPGSGSDVFKGVSVFLGLMLSLGSSSVVANIMAGMVITYMRPFKTGDHIKIGDQTGDVLEKTPFVTRILTHKKEVVTIPNSNILSSTVINYSTSNQDKGVIFHTTITIGYDAPWRKVHALMQEAAHRTEFVLQEPAPFVLQTSLDDFYVSYQLCVYTKNPEKQASINSALNSNIQDVFNENGVEIMSPHYRAERNGEQTTIPTDYATATPLEQPKQESPQ